MASLDLVYDRYSSSQVPTEHPSKTCDACRVRKIKCVQSESGIGPRKCHRCQKMAIDCTYDYTLKKAGRPKAAARPRRSTSRPSSVTPSTSLTRDRSKSATPQGASEPSPSSPESRTNANSCGFFPQSSQLAISHLIGFNGGSDLSTSNPQANGARFGAPDTGQSSTTRFNLNEDGFGHFRFPNSDNDGRLHGQGSSTNQAWNPLGNIQLPHQQIPPHTSPNFPLLTGHSDATRRHDDVTNAITIPHANTNVGGGSTWIGDAVSVPSNEAGQAQLDWIDNNPAFPDLPLFFDQQPHQMAGFASIATTSCRQGSSVSASIKGNVMEESALIGNIENITSWSNIAFFLTLFLDYEHAILPLIHKPTFSKDVITRRDKKSESFRGLLCSIVSYVICQLPKSKLTGEFTVPELEALHAKTRAVSRAIQVKQHNEPSMNLLISTIADHNTNLATGRYSLASALLAEACRYSYLLGLHRANPREGCYSDRQQGFNHVEVEINRRTFWHIYVCDKTEASSGLPILMHELEGVPPLPLEVDDELITVEGHLPQPPTRTSYITGFVIIAKLFRVLYGCLYRQRSFVSGLTTSAHAEMLRWIDEAELRIDKMLDEVPEVLKHGHSAEISGGEADVFGTQKANIWITAVCVKFALLDFKAIAQPLQSMKSARNKAATEAYQMLSSTPIEHLASNGESMRGKVLRIVRALLDSTSASDGINQNVWDWLSMYSKVQFVQVIPMDVEAIRPSRAASPVAK